MENSSLNISQNLMPYLPYDQKYASIKEGIQGKMLPRNSYKHLSSNTNHQNRKHSKLIFLIRI